MIWGYHYFRKHPYIACLIIYDRAGLNEGFQELPFGNSCPNLSLSFTVPYVSCFLRSYIIVILYPDMEITLKTRFTLILWTCPVDLNYVTPFMTIYHISLFYLCISIDISPWHSHDSTVVSTLPGLTSFHQFGSSTWELMPGIGGSNVRKKKWCVKRHSKCQKSVISVCQVFQTHVFPTRSRVGPEDFQHLWISWPLRFASKSHALDTSGHCWDSKEVAGDVWMAIQTWADLNDLRWLQIHQITTTSKVNRRRIN